MQIKKIILLLLVNAVLFIASANFVLAANETQDQLEQELKDIQIQIDQFTKDLSQTQSQKASLANKIKQLQVRQKTLNLQVQQTSLKIKKISGQLSVTEKSVEASLVKQKILKSQILDFIHQINNTSDNALIQLLSANGLTDVYVKIKEYSEITRALGGILDEHRKLVVDLGIKQNKLEDQKSEADNLLKISVIQKGDLNETLHEQNTLLVETKGLESNYQAAIKDSKKRVAEIKARIYELFNTGKQVDFGQAVEIAKMASKLTGVRPALLLADLTQESNLGKNVGTCNRAGDPVEKHWRAIMKPSRDHEPFLAITKELGLNPDTTPISCPMMRNGKQVGWGGAMGPAQFIPSTWMGYRSKVQAVTGRLANPWDIRDAFLAAGIKL